MSTTMTRPRGRPAGSKGKFSKERVSSPMLTIEAKTKLEEIAEFMGTSLPNLLSQLGESARNGKGENWHRAVGAFQDAIEK